MCFSVYICIFWQLGVLDFTICWEHCSTELCMKLLVCLVNSWNFGSNYSLLLNHFGPRWLFCQTMLPHFLILLTSSARLKLHTCMKRFFTCLENLSFWIFSISWCLFEAVSITSRVFKAVYYFIHGRSLENEHKQFCYILSNVFQAFDPFCQKSRIC